MVEQPPAALGGNRFRQAEEEALATFAPKSLIFASGFLAGFVMAWVPLILYLVLYYWEFSFGWAGTLTQIERQWLAHVHFRSNVSAYVAAAWPYSILLGTWGLFLAFLRAFSCLTDAYVKIPSSEGPIRFGLHQLTMAIGLPIVGLFSFYTIYPPPVFRAWLLPLFLSGFVFNVSFRFFQRFFLSLLYRPKTELRQSLALRVFLPRELGLRQVQVTNVHIDPGQRTATVTGWFEENTETYENVTRVIANALGDFDVIIEDQSRETVVVDEEPAAEADNERMDFPQQE